MVLRYNFNAFVMSFSKQVAKQKQPFKSYMHKTLPKSSSILDQHMPMVISPPTSWDHFYFVVTIEREGDTYPFKRVDNGTTLAQVHKW